MNKPYDEYIDRVFDDISHTGTYKGLHVDDLRELLADAWMDGLKYSLVMIESEKRRRDVPQD